MAYKPAEMLCGESTVRIEVPESAVILNLKPLPSLPQQEAAVYEALEKPLHSAPLSEIAKGRKNACIVISDFTRPVPNKIILPPLLATLELSGIKPENITILIATGMHRPNLGEELERLWGGKSWMVTPSSTTIAENPKNTEELMKLTAHPSR